MTLEYTDPVPFKSDQELHVFMETVYAASGVKVYVAGTPYCPVCGKDRCQKGCQLRVIKERCKAFFGHK